MMRKNSNQVLGICLMLLLIIAVDSKKIDPYKVLGVESNASQRDIQKAFHKLSLKYHPDKNNNKGAQDKFADINNAYDILSDEDKRKNYDLYGDGEEKGPGQAAAGWQNMGGASKSFSFSFGAPGATTFGFGMDDIFSNLFGFGSSAWTHQEQTKAFIQTVHSQFYWKEISDKGMTWLLLFHKSHHQGVQSVVSQVATSLQGALKVGSINCGSDASFCKELGVRISNVPKIFVYSFASSESGALVEFDGDLDVKSLKSFCQDHLPRFSKRVYLDDLDFASENSSKLPRVMLLSTKRKTPIIWRVLSGLHHKRILFYDAKVNDVSDPSVRKLGVDSLPAIVGWLSNGDKEILKFGISVKDLNSIIKELGGLLDSFVKKNKKAGSVRKENPESGDKDIQLLTGSNLNAICSEKVPVCVIGAFRSSKQRDRLQEILLSVSKKPFSRRQNMASGPKDLVSYSLLDAKKQQAFLNALDKSYSKSSDYFLVAYKAKRGTYATYQGEMTREAVERFISSVLNGDIQFVKTRQKPTVK